MNKTRLAILLATALMLFQGTGFSWEPYDRIIAVVNSIPIVESEVNDRLDYIQKSKKIPGKKIAYEKSRVLDKFIENALVYETAVDQSIIISDKRVLLHIENMMKSYFSGRVKNRKDLDATVNTLSARLLNRISNKKNKPDADLDKKLNDFIKFAESKQKMSFAQLFEEIRTQIRREQVMSIAIGVSPPSKRETKEWYRKNRKKLGYEVHVKHILIIPKSGTLSEEKKANRTISGLRKRILAGESFENLAKKYSQDPGSAKNGGDIGWTMLADLDPYFAGNVYRMKRVNSVSRVFKSRFGYHVVKYLGKRPVTYEKVEKMIMYKLYNENMVSQFEKWVARRKRFSEIRIYMEDYVENKKGA